MPICACKLLSVSFAAAIALTVGTHAQSGQDVRFHPFAQKPSPQLASKIQHWRLKFEEGDQIDAPEKGAFSSYSTQATGGAARDERLGSICTGQIDTCCGSDTVCACD